MAVGREGGGGEGGEVGEEHHGSGGTGLELAQNCPGQRGCELGARETQKRRKMINCNERFSSRFGRKSLEMSPHFRGFCVQASEELGPEDVSLLERCPSLEETYRLAHPLSLPPPLPASPPPGIAVGGGWL